MRNHHRHPRIPKGISESAKGKCSVTAAMGWDTGSKIAQKQEREKLKTELRGNNRRRPGKDRTMPGKYAEVIYGRQFGRLSGHRNSMTDERFHGTWGGSLVQVST